MHNLGLVGGSVDYWGRLQALCRALVLISCAGLFAYGIFVVFFWNFKTETPLAHATALGAGAVALAFSLRFGEGLKGALRRAVDFWWHASPRQWIGLCFVVGMVLRLVWLWPADYPLFADSVGLQRSATLATEGTLSTPGEHELEVAYAFYPPGHTLFAVPFSLLLGTQNWAQIVMNTAIFLGFLVLTYRMAETLADASAARLATTILVFWPNHIFGIVLIRKELWLMLLVPGILFAYMWAVSEKNSERTRTLRSALVGCLLGICVLMQPSSLFFITVLIAADLFCRRVSLRDVKRWLLMLVLTLSVVAPWSIRNYYVLGEFVPLTTGGAYALYVANNPNSTGGWVLLEDMVELHRQGVGEVEGARIARERALDWISANPEKFLLLIPHKLMRLMAKDGEFAYGAINVYLGIEDWRYEWLELGTSFYWLIFMILFMSSFARRRNWEGLSSYPFVLCMLSILYFASISSVFEGSGRHHAAAAMALLPIAAATTFRKRDDPFDPRHAG